VEQVRGWVKQTGILLVGDDTGRCLISFNEVTGKSMEQGARVLQVSELGLDLFAGVKKPRIWTGGEERYQSIDEGHKSDCVG